MARRFTLKQFARFSQKELPDDINDVLVAVRAKVAFDLLKGVMKRSPVDTGRYRGNWLVGINAPERAVIDPVPGQRPPKKAGERRSRRPASKRDTASGFAEIQSSRGINDVIWLSNNVPYAEVLERGRIGKSGSPQAPEGVASVTIVSVLGSQQPVIVVPEL